MITVVTDNLDEHTVLSLTVSTVAIVYGKIYEKMYYTKNLLFDIKLSHQYKEISIPLF